MITADPNAIRATWHWFAHAAHGVSEVRAIRPQGGVLGIGFFDDVDAFVAECLRVNAAANVYIGIQPRPRRLFELAPNAVRPLRTGARNGDIAIVTGTVIDLDPVRPPHTASTNEELALAVGAAERAAAWCEAEGLVRPRLMLSGNGAQLWFALPPLHLEGARREQIQAGLKAFEADVRGQVQTEQVTVDSVHDAARIVKVIGTVSRKGDGHGDRPHRTSAAREGVERLEDAALAARIERTPAPLALPAARRVSLPMMGAASATSAGSVRAYRTPAGELDWAHPVDMCAPVQRLWERGAGDRSAAIWNMVMYFAHKGLALDDILELVLEYDRRGLGKLEGRDGLQYVRHAYEKVLAGAREDGSIAPPCHALQRLHYCPVNREPQARCEIYDVVFDVEKAIDRIPPDLRPIDLEYRLRPVLDAIAHRDSSVWNIHLELLEKRFGLKRRDLRRALLRACKRRDHGDESDVAPDGIDEGNDTTRADFTIDGEVHENLAAYFTERGAAISSFIIAPTMWIATESTEYICGEAHTDRGRRIDLRLPLSAFHSRRDFLRHLPSTDMVWTGTDNNVQGLLRLLGRKAMPHRLGSTVLGEYRRGEHHLWLGPDCVIGKNGFLESPPVSYIPDGGSLDKRVVYRPTDDATFQRVADIVFRCLPQVNRPEVIVPMIGWFFATPMKPRLLERIGSFPILFVSGSPGSGKSALCTNVLWPLFGICDTDAYSATETEFALLKLLASTASIPIVLDEYKPYDMPRQKVNMLHRYMRRLYRSETEERGRPDLGVRTYHLRAPLCVAGETRPSEQALLERIVPVNPDRSTIDSDATCRAAFFELRSAELHLLAPRYIQFCLGRDFDSDFDVACSAANRLFDGRNVPIRIADNLRAMLLGVHLFEEFARACGCELGTELNAKAAVDAELADLVEMEHGAKSALDRFLEVVAVMAIQGELRHGVHYVFDKEHLALHLESAYDAFRAHCQRIAYEGELVDLRALRQLISENKRQHGYVLEESKRVRFGGRAAQRRAVIVDLTRTNTVTAADFPAPDDDAPPFGRRYGWGPS